MLTDITTYVGTIEMLCVTDLCLCLCELLAAFAIGYYRISISSDHIALSKVDGYISHCSCGDANGLSSGSCVGTKKKRLFGYIGGQGARKKEGTWRNWRELSRQYPPPPKYSYKDLLAMMMMMIIVCDSV